MSGRGVSLFFRVERIWCPVFCINRSKHFKFVISRSDSDEKSKRSLALLGTWISPCGRNDRKVEKAIA